MEEKGQHVTMPEEIVSGLARLSLPLPNDSLGSVNVYTVMSTDGLRLIDCGWNAPEVYAALGDELQQLGMQVSDIREILVTHNHPDHIGLAERLVQETGLLLHQLDTASEQAEPEERQSMLAEMEHWLHTNGMQQEEWETIMRGMRRMPFRIPTYHPDTLLEGGEVLDWSPFRFEVLWTPGHGAPFSNLVGRVNSLEAHHEQRLQAIIHVLFDEEQTAYAIASHLSWRGLEQGWQRLQPFDRLAALSETLAHLRYLTNQGQMQTQEQNGKIMYY